MQVKVESREDGVAKKFNVSGVPGLKSSFEMKGKLCELDLTLNGEYLRTPAGGSYCMLPKVPDSANSLGYHVILRRQPPRAEFQVFKLNDSPAITEADLPRLNINPERYHLLTIEYPKRIACLLDPDMLPSGVAKFLLQAKKCTSS